MKKELYIILLAALFMFSGCSSELVENTSESGSVMNGGGSVDAGESLGVVDGESSISSGSNKSGLDITQ